MNRQQYRGRLHAWIIESCVASTVGIQVEDSSMAERGLEIANECERALRRLCGGVMRRRLIRYYKRRWPEAGAASTRRMIGAFMESVGKGIAKYERLREMSE